MRITPSEVTYLGKLIGDRIKEITTQIGESPDMETEDSEKYSNLVEEKGKLESLDQRFDEAIEEVFERLLEQEIEI